MLIPLGFLSQSAGGGATAGSFDLISTTVLGSSAASVTFDVTGLGATYKHLQIRMTARTDRTVGLDNVSMQFNNDTSNTYTTHQLEGNGSAVSSASNTPLNRLLVSLDTGSTATANVFGASVTDLLDVFSSTKFKTIRALTGVAASSVRLYSGSWPSTATVTSIKLISDSGTNLVTGSRFSIYGVK